METLNYYSTEDIEFAALCLSLGIKFARKPHVIETPTGRRYTYFFEDVSEDGETKYADVLAAWHSPEEYIRQNPESPVSYIIAALKNRQSLLSNIKDYKQFVGIRQDGKIRLIPADLTPEQAEIYFKM